jgi:acetate kinase
MKSTAHPSEPATAAREFLKSQAEIFKDFSDEHLQQIVDGSSVRSFEPREVIMHRGEEATHFGVVLKGTVVGEGGDGVHLGELKPGDSFGELSLMTGDVMIADVVASSPCEVRLIPVSLFKSLIVAEPGVIQRVSRTIADRMKMLVNDPAKAAALRESDDPYGLKLKGERPEKILVINCGSSSLKYSFYDTADE